MIQITHNDQDLYIVQRITVLSMLRMLRKNEIQPNYIRRILPSQSGQFRDVETVTIDEAIEVLR